MLVGWHSRDEGGCHGRQRRRPACCSHRGAAGRGWAREPARVERVGRPGSLLHATRALITAPDRCRAPNWQTRKHGAVLCCVPHQVFGLQAADPSSFDRIALAGQPRTMPQRHSPPWGLLWAGAAVRAALLAWGAWQASWAGWQACHRRCQIGCRARSTRQALPPTHADARRSTERANRLLSPNHFCHCRTRTCRSSTQTSTMRW